MLNPISLARPLHALLIPLLLAAAHGSAQAPGSPPPAPSAAPAVSPGAPGAAPAAGAPARVDAEPATPSETDSLVEMAQALREGAESMTADQVAAKAVRTAPSVRRAQAANQKANEAAGLALVAVYPRLDLEASYTRLSEHAPTHFGNITGPMGGQAMMFSVDSPQAISNLFLLQARLSYPVSDLFFQILPRTRAARGAARAQELSSRAESETVALQAREAFYNYARARASLLVARSTQAQSEAQRRDVASLVSAGTLARVELMRADAQVATARVAVARSEGAVAVARTALRTLLHQPGEQEIAIAERLGEPLPPLTQSQDALYQEALHNRVELAALRIMADVNETYADANAAGGLPKLSVAGTAELSNPNQRVAPFDEKWEPSWTAMGLLSWSPNDLAASGKSAGQSEADRAQTLADIQSLEDALRREVAQAYNDYQAAGQAMDAAMTGIRAAEESYRVRREQFRAGAAVATDVIDAEAELRRSRLELINAAIDVRVARARLDRAVGRDSQA